MSLASEVILPRKVPRVVLMYGRSRVCLSGKEDRKPGPMPLRAWLAISMKWDRCRTYLRMPLFSLGNLSCRRSSRREVEDGTLNWKSGKR